MSRPAVIALEDGACFEAETFSGRGEIYGELVFNTSLCGYQEILTDPSYRGQIVTMTYPLIGNYGINHKDMESYRPHAEGFVVGEYSRIASNWRSTMTLAAYLESNGILGVHQVDTRAITLHIRSKGAMKCVVSTEDLDKESLIAKAKASEGLIGRDLVSEVTVREPFKWTDEHSHGRTGLRVAALDCGLKYNQLRILSRLGCDIEVYPVESSTTDIATSRPDGFFISNGPGDPDGVPQVVETVRSVIQQGIPTFGICFGHQLLGLALGGKTYKLKFGHRGSNQPVMDLQTGKVEITSQNHGFCVDKDSLDTEQVETTHINLNDGTSEGLRHRTLPVFSVQYHPEAAPGPNDAMHLFNRFVSLMEQQRDMG